MSENREFTPKGIEDYPFQEDHVYIVDVAWRSSNPVHRAILHVGFLNKDHSFGGYCEVWSHNYEESRRASKAYYLKVVKDLGWLRDEKMEHLV